MSEFVSQHLFVDFHREVKVNIFGWRQYQSHRIRSGRQIFWYFVQKISRIKVEIFSVDLYNFPKFPIFPKEKDRNKLNM